MMAVVGGCMRVQIVQVVVMRLMMVTHAADVSTAVFKTFIAAADVICPAPDEA